MMANGGLSRSNSYGGDTHSLVSQSLTRKRSLAQRELKAGNQGPSEVLNQRALAVIDRVRSKLAGTDFSDETLPVSNQVNRLIEQATSDENLSVAYVGWCPFW